MHLTFNLLSHQYGGSGVSWGMSLFKHFDAQEVCWRTCSCWGTVCFPIPLIVSICIGPMWASPQTLWRPFTNYINAINYIYIYIYILRSVILVFKIWIFSSLSTYDFMSFLIVVSSFRMFMHVWVANTFKKVKCRYYVFFISLIIRLRINTWIIKVKRFSEQTS